VTALEPTPARRRVPKQARARERFGRILDAARRELEERPIADVTIEAIALRADVPVGSLYQYFASKSALLAAVAEAVMADADALTSRVLADCHALAWRDSVDRIVRTTLEFLRASPDYRTLLRAMRFTPEFAEITAASNERVADLFALHPAFARAGLSRARSLTICRTAVTAVNALQDRAIADESLDFESAITECQCLTKGYLATYLP
jgi:AcrR family transcriptional regulator